MLKKLKVFISSVQNEFASERKELASYLRHDPLLTTKGEKLKQLLQNERK